MLGDASASEEVLGALTPQSRSLIPAPTKCACLAGPARGQGRRLRDEARGHLLPGRQKPCMPGSGEIRLGGPRGLHGSGR